ncbi:50S ribosomal protein L3 N(5)-glutamine methyltransferase [Methylococcus mesophilus]|uniref:50S ribosomal protein L3 N(5)-glutamine methyltransferase n=1 Tax=Methylococcus mesophilus TaxID=2993564 RepID=UPI00224AAEED|nr:50S ribosomal protein L3 N(5)-glutamine methyltransferase [Methylococcus mesophilus]UZR30450.1 50S ribosomal protein L3 N(5)-glutamine methyltransferase [Methylococcus mesophilus]
MKTTHPSVLETLTTVRDYIRWGATRFSEAGVFFGHGTGTALDEAAALVMHVIRQPHDMPSGYFSAVLTFEERERILHLVDRRIEERVPLAYLTHEAWFAGLKFYVDERVLVPRSPIAELIENQFQPWLEPDAVGGVLDLCTGSGCIAIACAEAFPQARVDAVDISGGALEVARMNVRAHGLEDAVRLVHSDLFQQLDGGRYDLIVSNPPYVNRQEWRDLPSEYHAEPRLGLESGEDGLDCVRRILAGAADRLKPNGVLVVEVGSSAEALAAFYPEVDFLWLDFEHGGDGVFLLTAAQVERHRDLFERSLGPETAAASRTLQ